MKTFENIGMPELTHQELFDVNGGSVATYAAGYSAGATVRQWIDNVWFFRAIVELF
ncbi:hypothetical protein [Microbacter margulisiae]|uniref:Uncharacterized protein n=1 Tax=Microbacter margulisiae TaxID=1350067 RepID=A0A7W5DTE2_9PORP|nr:hypothetical protein [Microbacter margulisiae]MBB3188740.1 hypothetical protein [Microbacter margulisiae]